MTKIEEPCCDGRTLCKECLAILQRERDWVSEELRKKA